jgi:hypothetical protein
MSLKETVIAWANNKLNDCHCCSHPSGSCSGSCQICLDEIHWGPTTGKRCDYDCDKLVYQYVLKYIYLYTENIKSACQTIDLNQYPVLNILSVGCGSSPDLMAFAELSQIHQIAYNGVDRNNHWDELHKLIENYADTQTGITVNYEDFDLFHAASKNVNTVYNIVVMQFVISSILNNGGRESDILKLFNDIVKSVVNRWINSNLNSPILFILNDVDSLNKGRNCFYKLIDILEKIGYQGKAYAYSSHSTGDLGNERWSDRKNDMNYGAIEYQYSHITSNNSATLVIEVKK